MADNDRDATENRIRRLFQRMAFQMALGVFFLGLGVQASIIHSTLMVRDDHAGIHMGILIVDTALFFISAVGIMRGVRSLGRALMLIAGMNPDWPQS